MTRLVRCDACGHTADTAALQYDVGYTFRIMGGQLKQPSGEYLDWPREETQGHLCADCADDAIAALQTTLFEETNE